MSGCSTTTHTCQDFPGVPAQTAHTTSALLWRQWLGRGEASWDGARRRSSDSQNWFPQPSHQHREAHGERAGVVIWGETVARNKLHLSIQTSIHSLTHLSIKPHHHPLIQTAIHPFTSPHKHLVINSVFHPIIHLPITI